MPASSSIRNLRQTLLFSALGLMLPVILTACGAASGASLPGHPLPELVTDIDSQTESTPPVSSNGQSSRDLVEAVHSDRRGSLRAIFRADGHLDVQTEDFAREQSQARLCAISPETTVRLRELVHQLRTARVPSRSWDCPLQDPEVFTGLHVARVGSMAPTIGDMMFLLKRTEGQGSCGDFAPVHPLHRQAADLLQKEIFDLARHCSAQ